MAIRIDLNADVGEATSNDANACELALLDVVTSVHIACGFHAGDAASMHRLVVDADRHHVAVGAHPSYPDRVNFGRAPINRTPAQVADDVISQVGALIEIAAPRGVPVVSVKPHGALYHRLAHDEPCLVAVIDALGTFNAALRLVLPAGTPAVTRATASDIRVVREGFCDRAYLADGSLASRNVPGALVTDPGAAGIQAHGLAVDGEVHTVDGTVLALECDTLCIHGDTPGAVGIAERVRSILRAADVVIAAPSSTW